MNRLLLSIAFLLILLRISPAQESEEYELKQLRLAEAQRYAMLNKLSKTATPNYAVDSLVKVSYHSHSSFHDN